MIHPIFNKFKIIPETLNENYMQDFLGVMTKKIYLAENHIDWTLDWHKYPLFNEEYIEWIDVLTSVVMAKEKFTMIVLGAGWGRWISRAHAAMKQIHPEMPAHYIAIEGEPTHFQWLMDHCRNNRMSHACLLIEGAVNDTGEDVMFHTGRPSEWYGQCIGGDTKVKAFALEQIFKMGSVESVDLIDLDIQGHEYIVLNSSKHLLSKVKKIHIGTHSKEVEKQLQIMFSEMNWTCINDYSLFTKHSTKYGEAEFNDGIQTWVNPDYIHEYNKYINTIFRSNRSNFLLS